MEDAAFDPESMNDLKDLLLENCRAKPTAGPMSDLVNNSTEVNPSIQHSSSLESSKLLSEKNGAELEGQFK